jgi:hypothetical protein
LVPPITNAQITASHRYFAVFAGSRDFPQVIVQQHQVDIFKWIAYRDHLAFHGVGSVDEKMREHQDLGSAQANPEQTCVGKVFSE